jgi:hypothetical protein
MSWHPTALASLRAAYPTGGWHSDTGDIFGAIGGRLVIVTRDRRDGGWFRALLTRSLTRDVEGMDPRDAARAVTVALDRATGARRPMLHDVGVERG